MNRNILVTAIASLLFGGIATAAYMNNHSDGTSVKSPSVAAADLARPSQASVIADDRQQDTRIPSAPHLEYAEVIAVKPITRKQQHYATVIGTEPVRETVTGTAPREVCEDVAVEARQPERDGNVGGTVAGAVIGGLLGNQVGDGDGRKAATAAGAVVGGYIGNRVDRRHEGGKVLARTERQCHTVTETTSSRRTVAWNVTYRNPDGSTSSMRTDRRPGNRIPLGTEKTVIGYDVTYRYQGHEQRLRMAEKPENRLPVIDGQVVAPVAVVDAGDHRG